MKKIIYLFFLVPFSLSAQNLISTAGSEKEGVIWSVGDIITETLTNNNLGTSLTQGFIQPYYLPFSSIINTQECKTAVRVYPNPVKEKLYIDTDQQPCVWSIQDSFGKLLDSGKLSGLSSEYIDVVSYAPGYYILTVTTTKETASIKMVK